MSETAGFFDPGVGDYVVLDGNIIERKSLYLVEKIKDYDENIEVLCVDPDRADSPFEEPFQIAEWVNTPTGRELRIMFGVWELNDLVYERILQTDAHNGVDLQKVIEDHNKKVKAEQDRKAAEKADARKDLVTTIVKDRKSQFTFKRESDDALVTIYDDRPAEVKA